MFDLIIQGARVVDGTGNPWYYADVGVRDGIIAALGRLPGDAAAALVYGNGLVVSPGFIDIHSHADTDVMVNPRAESAIRQGVTTLVTGNCGFSAAPITAEKREELKAGDLLRDLEISWLTMAEYLVALERCRPSVNLVPLVGHGTLRNVAMGYEQRPPTPAESQKMAAHLSQAMAEGAWGLSSGLIYPPGCYADTPELVELARVTAGYGGIYASHIRGENDTLLDAVVEAITIGEQAGLPVQIAHFKAMGRHMWGKSRESLGLVDRARAGGLEVTCDQYPYEASATGLAAFLPPWTQQGGNEGLFERLRRPDTRLQITADLLNGVPGWVSLHKGVGWANVVITSSPSNRFDGQTVSAIAASRQQDDFECVYDLLLEEGNRVGVVYFTISPEDIIRIMQHPAVMIGSDSGALAPYGPLSRGKPHPRTYGTFARVLGKYVREGVLSLERAVSKMTSLPAQKLGLHDRGLIRPGFAADLVLFSPEAINDTATYAEPHAYPTGVQAVVVNGVLSVEDGEHAGAGAGRVLRRPA